jgi:hypothetical protein
MVIRMLAWLLSGLLVVEAAPVFGAQKGLHPVHVTRLYRVSTGEFSVGVPNAAWTATSSMNFGNRYTELLTVGQRNGSLPQAYVYTMLPITLMASGFMPRLQRCAQLKNANPLFDSLSCVRNAVQTLVAASQRGYSARDAVSVIADAASSMGVRMQIESLRSSNATRAEFTVRTARQSTIADELAVVRVFHVYDPAVAAFVPNATATYAFLEGCRAAPGTLTSAMAVCNQIFRSFRPANGWLQQRVAAAAQDNRQLAQIVAQLIQTLVQDQAQAAAMINRTVSHIGEMQMESQMNAMAVKTQIDDGWIKSLGSQTYFGNSTGEYYSTNQSYNYYCQNTFNGQFWGTNNVFDLDKPECGKRYSVDIP